jgi:hypothetical protein
MICFRGKTYAVGRFHAGRLPASHRTNVKQREPQLFICAAHRAQRLSAVTELFWGANQVLLGTA